MHRTPMQPDAATTEHRRACLRVDAQGGRRRGKAGGSSRGSRAHRPRPPGHESRPRRGSRPSRSAPLCAYLRSRNANAQGPHRHRACANGVDRGLDLRTAQDVRRRAVDGTGFEALAAVRALREAEHENCLRGRHAPRCCGRSPGASLPSRMRGVSPASSSSRASHTGRRDAGAPGGRAHRHDENRCVARRLLDTRPGGSY